MSRFIAGFIVLIGVGALTPGSVEAQVSTNAQAPGKCWTCGDQWGFNPDKCYYHENWSFGQAADRCNTVYHGGGSTCQLTGTLCGNPFFTALDGSAVQPAIQLASLAVVKSGTLRDCQRRVVLRGTTASGGKGERVEQMVI